MNAGRIGGRATLLVASALCASIGVAAEVDCVPQTAIDVGTIRTQLVVVGETHGTEEIPRFVAGLVCSLARDGRPVILAIEHTSDEQPALNRYLSSRGTASDRDDLTSGRAWHAKSQYGTTSEAMLALIESMRRLREQGQRVGVLAIDRAMQVDVGSDPRDLEPLSAADNALYSRTRDRAMADRLLAAAVYERNHTIVSLTGSFHSSNRHGKATDPDDLPMAWWLEQQQPTFAIGFDAAAGTAWVCTASCGAQPRRADTLFVDGTRIDALVRLSTQTASPPAIAAR